MPSRHDDALTPSVRAVHRFMLDGAEITVFVHEPAVTDLGVDSGDAGAKLTPAMHQLARLVEAGLSQKEMAERLGVSLGAVRKRLDMLYKTYGVHSRTELAAKLNGLRTSA